MRHGRRGMTLTEITVAIAITLVMSVMVWETTRNTIEFGHIISLQDEATRGARVAMGRLRRDLQLAFLTKHLTAQESYRTIFVALDDDPDLVYFSTLAHQRIYANSRECDQSEVTIFAEDAPRDRGNGHILYHRESPRIDEEPAEGGKVYPLAYNVRSFDLRYLDSKTNEWRDDWDSRDDIDTANRLPRAVEIGLVLIAPDMENPDRTVDIPHLSRVTLEFADRLTPSMFNPGAAQAAADAQAGANANASPGSVRKPEDDPRYGDGAGRAINRVQRDVARRRAGAKR
ncbi:MAG: prepilin-type N-terminal cleavage/methylation domain-containing protein [Proteobacteria bacterium]|jgi:general secretion pathway protein J|nr:prepilin-type N-terminal cleavage/methylation domain-containing protein [Pseudomonadota bacterium]